MSVQSSSAFEFEGSWREYAPIALTNLLLTIVTLGIYQFWATTRTRRYLWSRSRFIDDRLEWTGTGLELLIGWIMVFVLFGIPFVFLQFGAQALTLQGHGGIAAILTLLAVFSLFYLTGVARLRMLRYRLSRTWWHGIRGGSDDMGWAYGLSFVWRTIAGWMPFGLLVPWSMTSLWNQRWNAMSFGPFNFQSGVTTGNVFLRYLLFYLIPFIIFAGMAILALSGVGALFADFDHGETPGFNPAALLAGIGAVALFYGLTALIALAYYAKFFREAVGNMSLSTLDFAFSARSIDWVKLILGDIALVIVTLGIGIIFLDYRHWKFFISHMEARGEISMAALTQSTTAEPGHGEGLASAFDLGAI